MPGADDGDPEYLELALLAIETDQKNAPSLQSAAAALREVWKSYSVTPRDILRSEQLKQDIVTTLHCPPQAADVVVRSIGLGSA